MYAKKGRKIMLSDMANFSGNAWTHVRAVHLSDHNNFNQYKDVEQSKIIESDQANDKLNGLPVVLLTCGSHRPVFIFVKI